MRPTRGFLDVITAQNPEVVEDLGHDSGHGRLTGAGRSSEHKVAEVRRFRSLVLSDLEGIAQLGQLRFDSVHAEIKFNSEVVVNVFRMNGLVLELHPLAFNIARIGL